MSIGMILSLVLPIAGNLIKALFQRIISNRMTTLQGAGASALVLGFLNSIGCDFTVAQEGIIGGITALPGLLGTDAGTTAKSFLQVATETAMRKKGESVKP